MDAGLSVADPKLQLESPDATKQKRGSLDLFVRGVRNRMEVLSTPARLKSPGARWTRRALGDRLLWWWTGWSVGVYRQTRGRYWRVGQVVRTVSRWDGDVVTIERRRNWQWRRIGSIVYCDWLFQQNAIASAWALLDCTNFACDRVASDRCSVAFSGVQWCSPKGVRQTFAKQFPRVFSRRFIIVWLFHHFKSFDQFVFSWFQLIQISNYFVIFYVFTQTPWIHFERLDTFDFRRRPTCPGEKKKRIVNFGNFRNLEIKRA